MDPIKFTVRGLPSETNLLTILISQERLGHSELFWSQSSPRNEIIIKKNS